MTATSREFDKAETIYAILSEVYDQSPWSLDQVRADLTQPQTESYLVYEDGGPVGFLTLQDLMGELEITNIAIRPSHQGRGLAKQLLRRLLDERSEPVFLEVRASNSPAQQLYRGLGFEEIGRRKNYYQHPQEDALIMRREGL